MDSFCKGCVGVDEVNKCLIVRVDLALGREVGLKFAENMSKAQEGGSSTLW